MELSVKDVYLLDFYNGRIKDYTQTSQVLSTRKAL